MDFQSKCAIEELFNAVKTGHKDKARAALKQAHQEHDILKRLRNITESGKKSIKLVEGIISLVSEEKFAEAKKNYEKAQTGFSGHLKRHLTDKMREIKEVETLSVSQRENHSKASKLTEGKQGQNQADFRKSQRSEISTGQSQLQHEESKQTPTRQSVQRSRPTDFDMQVRYQETASTTDTVDDQSSITAREDFQKIERSKRASIKMRQNNPDIADLSDTNRPTKIAERFSELYDNEWTEAFEEISNKKNWIEKKTIEYLLSVVKEAYQFCTNAAESQINQIINRFNEILEFGPDNYNKETSKSQPNRCSEDGRHLIVQYRKGIANIALQRLNRVFVEDIVHSKNTRHQLPARLKAVDLFATKALELTWWMCVQDPPIYLCPTPENENEEFDKSLYKAYTKSGITPDFFVWPALRLYKEGGILAKGVVQYL
ncbi:uncharacterized protein LOC128555630 isoform X1 [Mercenaria mercenaria]|uniref:uncharacterized protein LOC128555630 isoform X1 n=1 Tax=Mercenaria mercenaria TaxID=6596 RepID=UPI00234F80D4|nr:uncharacterized protein LOC128555630 isoform X1 [Mercenaria mercenaria]